MTVSTSLSAAPIKDNGTHRSTSTHTVQRIARECPDVNHSRTNLRMSSDFSSPITLSFHHPTFVLNLPMVSAPANRRPSSGSSHERVFAQKGTTEPGLKRRASTEGVTLMHSTGSGKTCLMLSPSFRVRVNDHQPFPPALHRNPITHFRALRMGDRR